MAKVALQRLNKLLDSFDEIKQRTLLASLTAHFRLWQIYNIILNYFDKIFMALNIFCCGRFFYIFNPCLFQFNLSILPLAFHLKSGTMLNLRRWGGGGGGGGVCCETQYFL